MPDIDYETEYDNRARVPEHPEIFARWTRDAELFRAEALKSGRAELGMSYGDTPRQYLDLFLPAADESAPLAVFIHGGWWRSLDPSFYSHVARGPNALGVGVAVVGYDLCPTVSIADIIEQMRRACAFLWQRFGRRMLVYGHSAGGHLSAAMVGTDWVSLYPKAPADLIPAGYSISCVFDLAPLVGISVNQDLRLDAAKARGVSDVAFQKKRGLAVTDMTKSAWVYRKLRNFRAGIEAGISCFKRAYGAGRCTWRGLDHFKAYVWSAVVAHNLVLFARLKPA